MRHSQPHVSVILRRLAPLAFIPLAVLYLWPLAIHPGWVAYPPGSNYTDLLLSHLPNVLYLRDSLAKYGQWPLWNGQIFAGLPFAADPLAGMWYPPSLLLLLLPLPLGFNLLLALHLAWAGYGMFRFLRGEGLGAWASLLGAAAFAGTPKLVAHLGAGHVTLVYAVAWTPWLLLAVRNAAPRGTMTLARSALARSALARGAIAGAVLAITFLADVRWAYYAGLLAVAYWAALTLGWVGEDQAGAGPRNWASRIYPLLSFGFFFVMLSAVLALPLVELARAASRSALTLADGGVYSLPPIYLLGLLIPDLRGFHEWMTYLGVVPLMLALAGIGRRTWFWGVVAVLAAAYSLGTNFVLFPLAFRLLPLASLLRVPPRAWFLVALSAAILAGHGLQRLLDVGLPWLRRRYAIQDGRGDPAPTKQPRRIPSARMAAGVLLALTVLDLLRVDSTLYDARPIASVPATVWLGQQAGLFRVYSPTFTLPYWDGRQHLDGVDPLQLPAALNLIEPAIGVRAAGYDVVVPSYGQAVTPADMAMRQPNAAGLAALDVKYVVSEFDLTGVGFELSQTFGNERIYLNRDWTGRAWVEGQPAGAASVVFWSPNKVVVQAAGPGRLVVSEINYPGWQALVDGQAATIETADGALRAIDLSAGTHVVDFVFRPASVYLGGGLTVLGLAGLALLLWWARQK